MFKLFKIKNNKSLPAEASAQAAKILNVNA
jgi:hypothetical protein